MVEDWSNLNQDIFDLILSNLLAEDQHTFSLVCPSWHKALLASPHRHSPCLIYNQNSNHLWRFFQHNTCFSKRFMTILQNSVIRFSNHGWLLMMSRDDNTIFFYDPFNNHTIQLPNLPRYKSYTTICFFHPPTSPECFIVGIRAAREIRCPRDVMDIGLLRQGEGEWKAKRYFTKEFCISCAPPVFNRGLVYFVDVKGNVATFDINLHGRTRIAWCVSNRCMRQRRFRRSIKEHFLVKARDEDSIFAVFGMMREERDVRVFRLVESDMRWEAVDSLGEKVLYVSNTSSHGYTTSDKSMANKIFFPMLHGDKFVYYSLETDKYHDVEGSYSSQDSHGLKKLDFATWTMPSQKLINSAHHLSWRPQLNLEAKT